MEKLRNKNEKKTVKQNKFENEIIYYYIDFLTGVVCL